MATSWKEVIGMTAEPQVETWLYAGQREVAGHQLAHAWWPADSAGDVDPEEQLLLYKKLPGVAIGNPYAVKVSRDGDRTTAHGRPEYAGHGTPSATPAQCAIWQSYDRNARRSRERYLAERRAAQDDQVELALAPMLRLITDARTRADKRALVARAYELLNAASWME